MRRVRADVGDLEETASVPDDASHYFSIRISLCQPDEDPIGVHVLLLGGRGSIPFGHGLESAATTKTRRVESASRTILERGMDAHRLSSPLLKGMEDAGKNSMGSGMDIGAGYGMGKNLLPTASPSCMISTVNNEFGSARADASGEKGVRPVVVRRAMYVSTEGVAWAIV